MLISNDLKDDADICRQLRSLYTQGNILLRKFKRCSNEVKCQLFRSYCANLYCASLWCNYKGSTFSKVKVAYNNVFRMLLSVETRQVYHAYVNFNLDSFQTVIRKSIYRFKQRLLMSSNSVISNIVNSMKFLSGSKLCGHWTVMLYNL